MVQQSCDTHSFKSVCHSIGCCHSFGKYKHSLCIPLGRWPASHSLLQQCEQAVSMLPSGEEVQGCGRGLQAGGLLMPLAYP